jgi:hypothetical protein
MTNKAVFAGLLLFVIASLCGQSECSDSDLTTLPFDATGAYAGAWSGVVTVLQPDGTSAGNIELSCAFALELVHEHELVYPLNTAIVGTISFDMSCLDSLGLDLPEVAIPVAGVVDETGAITLTMGGCVDDVCAVLELIGQGADVDGDGLMDLLESALTLELEFAEPLGAVLIDGEIAAARNWDAA